MGEVRPGTPLARVHLALTLINPLRPCFAVPDLGPEAPDLRSMSSRVANGTPPLVTTHGVGRWPCFDPKSGRREPLHHVMRALLKGVAAVGLSFSQKGLFHGSLGMTPVMERQTPRPGPGDVGLQSIVPAAASPLLVALESSTALGADPGLGLIPGRSGDLPVAVFDGGIEPFPLDLSAVAILRHGGLFLPRGRQRGPGPSGS